MFEEFIFGKILDEVLKNIKTFLRSRGTELKSSKDDFNNSLNYHYKYIENWSKEIYFSDMVRPKLIDNTYIDLDIQLAPKKILPFNSKPEKFKIEELLKYDDHLVVLGDPGAGKTTTMKHICQKILHSDFEDSRYNYAILIELKKLKLEEYVFDKLSSILNIQLSPKNQKEELSAIERRQILERAINIFIEETSPILIIDGLDEVHPKKMNKIVNELQDLFLHLSNAKTVITCRSAAFNISLSNSQVFEICPLDKPRILTFASNWFNNRETTRKFISQLQKSPYGGVSVRPLLLAHLCVLFEKSHKIPEKPKSVYKKFVNLLIEEWDIERNIERKSKYSNFEPDRKLEFLANFAYNLTITYGKTQYTEKIFREVYHFIRHNFGLPKNDSKNVISEIESHTGLILQTSSDTYEFSHSSIQEYLCAEHISRMPNIPKKQSYDFNILNELAIAVCLSSNPNQYFSTLIFETFESQNIENIEEFLSRLFLEKPDFYSTPVLGFTFYYIFHKYYSDEFGLDQDKDEKYESIFKKFISIKEVHKSIIDVKNYLTPINLPDFEETDLMFFDVDRNSLQQFYYFDFPSEIYIHKKYWSI